MKYELDLINHTFEEELERQGIMVKRLSDEVHKFSEDDVYSIVRSNIKDIFNTANIHYIGEIEIEKIENTPKSSNYILSINCIDKVWRLENAFEARGTENNILVFLRGPINTVLSYYGNFYLDYAVVSYFQEGIKSSCYQVLLSDNEKEWLKREFNKYHFAKKLYDSNKSTFKNVCIRMTDFRFEAKLNYRFLNEPYLIEKAIGFISNIDKFIHNCDATLNSQLFASNEINNSYNDFIDLGLEILCLLNIKEPFLKIFQNEHITIFNVSKKDKKIKIELRPNLDFKTFIKEFNHLLNLLDKSERIFYVHDNRNSRFFLAKKDYGLALINLYNDFGEFKLENREKIVNREIRYFEKGQSDIIGKIDFMYPPIYKLVNIEPLHLDAISNNNFNTLENLLNMKIQEGLFSDLKYKPYYESLKNKNEEKPWNVYFIIHLESNLLHGTCGFKKTFLEEGVLEMSYDCTNWETIEEITKKFKEIVSTKYQIKKIITHHIRQVGIDEENSYYDLEYR